MKRFYEKLKSESGASIVFALLVFLLCVLAGTVALTAASANAGRYTHLEEEQKQYFSVASALALLQGQMDKKGPITITATYEVTEQWYYVNKETDPTKEPKYELETQTTMYGLTLNPRLYSAGAGYYETLLYRDYVPDEWWSNMSAVKPGLYGLMDDLEYTINPPDDYKDSLYPVKVTVKKGMDNANYALEMHLTTGNDAYPLKVVWTSDPDVTTETKVETTGDPTNVGPGSRGTRTTTTTITCTLTWSKEDRTVTFE